MLVATTAVQPEAFEDHSNVGEQAWAVVRAAPFLSPKGAAWETSEDEEEDVDDVDDPDTQEELSQHMELDARSDRDRRPFSFPFLWAFFSFLRAGRAFSFKTDVASLSHLRIVSQIAMARSQ